MSECFKVYFSAKSWFFFKYKSVSITCSECVSVALIIQHTLGMYHVILSSVNLFYFSTYLIKATIFGGGEKNSIEHKMCILIFSTTFA